MGNTKGCCNHFNNSKRAEKPYGLSQHFADFTHENPHVTEKTMYTGNYGRVAATSLGVTWVIKLSQIDPSTAAQRKADSGFGLGGLYLESLLLLAAGRGGILSLIWSRYFASENPLILWVGSCALNTTHRQTQYNKYLTAVWPPGSTDTVCPRPPPTLTFDRLTLKLVCELHLRCGTFIPNVGTLGRWVQKLFTMYATDGQTDRQKQRLINIDLQH